MSPDCRADMVRRYNLAEVEEDGVASLCVGEIWSLCEISLCELD
jgi:hypothetical protein